MALLFAAGPRGGHWSSGSQFLATGSLAWTVLSSFLKHSDRISLVALCPEDCFMAAYFVSLLNISFKKEQCVCMLLASSSQEFSGCSHRVKEAAMHLLTKKRVFHFLSAYVYQH